MLKRFAVVILFLLPLHAYAQVGPGPVPYRGVNNWNLIFGTDNTYDIGAVGATRPRTGYFGTSVVTPALTVSGLTSTRVPVAGVGGLLGDFSTFTFNSGTGTVSATNFAASSGVTAASVTDSGLTATRCTFAGVGGLLSDDADCTFATDRLTVTNLTAGSITDSGLTPGRVPQASTAGLLSDSADQEVLLISGKTATAGVETTISLRSTADLAATDFALVVEDNNGTDLLTLGGTGALISTGTMQALGGNVTVGASATRLAIVDSTGLVTRSGGQVGMGSSATDAGGGPDTAIGRHSAGVLKATNGSTGIRHFMGGGANVASATALPLPTGNVFHVTGTNNITSVTATNFLSGVVVTLIFDGALTFTDGNNLLLAGNFVTTADDTITLAYDGTNFYEIARSVN